MFNERRNPRYKVKLPCRVWLREFDLATSTVDISVGGARLILPAAAILLFSSANFASAVRIGDLPKLGATVRWHRMREFGVAFTEPAFARRHIQELIDGLEQDGRLPEPEPVD